MNAAESSQGRSPHHRQMRLPAHEHQDTESLATRSRPRGWFCPLSVHVRVCCVLSSCVLLPSLPGVWLGLVCLECLYHKSFWMRACTLHLRVFAARSPPSRTQSTTGGMTVQMVSIDCADGLSQLSLLSTCLREVAFVVWCVFALILGMIDPQML